MVSRAKIHSGVLFFVERWSFSLQDHIFLAFFELSETCLS